MKFLLQRVSAASVSIEGKVHAEIAKGYVLFVGVMKGDREADVDWIAEKVIKLRLFEGDGGKINDRSLVDVQGHVLIISQFTLAGRTEKGNRPDFTHAEEPARAQGLYNYCIQKMKALGVERVESGVFGASMQVSLTNDGPVTLLLEKKKD